MKLRNFIFLSLALHFLLFWTLRPKELPIQDLSEVQIIETLPNPKFSTEKVKPPSRKIQVPASQIKKESSTNPDNSPQEPPSPEESATGENAEAPPNNFEAVSVGAVTEAPKVLQEKKIPYPISARRAGVEGVVELKLVIDPEGHVQSAELVRGPGYGLDEAALGAIKDFIFSPAKIGNQKVAVRILYKYRFRLGGS